MKHARLLGAVAAVMALTLAGCGTGTAAPSASGSAPNASAPAEKVSLTFWGTYGNGGNSSQTKALAPLIDSFEKANPDITINYVDMPYDQLKQTLTTAAAGGELPDLLRSDIGWIAQYGKLGAFAPLDQTMPDFKTFADAVYPGTLAANAWNGHYYGLPLDTNTRVLVTSPEALKAAGLSKPPATFAEFTAMADKLKGTKIKAFADGGLGQWNIMPWIWSGGGALTDDAVTKASGYLDSPKSVAAVQMLVDLYKAGQIPNLITGNQGATGTSDGLPGGNYASILDGPWMVDIWKQQYPKFAPNYSPVPAGDGGSVSVIGGESIVMSTSTKHAEAALKFIRFTQSEEFQLAMAATGQMPVVEATGTKAATQFPYLAPFAEQLKTAKSRLNIPEAAKVDTILNNHLTEAFKGTATVQAALTAAAAEIDPLLAK
ncbi:carbohydrate ABC transporter substrate-binding protein (CUT1 family) [Propionicimonas paludicola]|uniref:Carbohydrate ABC transporter substrate-binding protein (CUT1 family) n=1 Tax=Propionicimonas paludicola TaxID=185243 RepID=A0A2A9CQ65_9ACTN|nr:extracellular solute-binding protein [Propionicimonas paludicola]PFG16225.1 carbohydrate ABC transporter substrate-binding protein (CUT1 family) [Propionicimonas paludicola]